MLYNIRLRYNHHGQFGRWSLNRLCEYFFQQSFDVLFVSGDLMPSLQQRVLADYFTFDTNQNLLITDLSDCILSCKSPWNRIPVSIQ
jgi:hypothetical protein